MRNMRRFWADCLGSGPNEPDAESTEEGKEEGVDEETRQKARRSRMIKKMIADQEKWKLRVEKNYRQVAEKCEKLANDIQMSV